MASQSSPDNGIAELAKEYMIASASKRNKIVNTLSMMVTHPMENMVDRGKFAPDFAQKFKRPSNLKSLRKSYAESILRDESRKLMIKSLDAGEINIKEINDAVNQWFRAVGRSSLGPYHDDYSRDRTCRPGLDSFPNMYALEIMPHRYALSADLGFTDGVANCDGSSFVYYDKEKSSGYFLKYTEHKHVIFYSNSRNALAPNKDIKGIIEKHINYKIWPPYDENSVLRN